MLNFTVAPIGTCRLHNTLRRGALRYGYGIQLTHNYGFTHTSSEALQQLRYMLGEIQFPDDVARLIRRPAPSTSQVSKTHEIADLYLIEISSAKLLTCRQYFVQLNYVYRYFSDFFSDKERTRWFWMLANDARAPELALRLAVDPAFNRLDAVDQALLVDLRQSEVTPETIGRDVSAIIERLGRDRVVLVTHVNAQLSDGSVVASRARLIDEVVACAGRLGVRSFDPTPLMHALGQSQAMERFGLDLTHFTDMFSDRLCAALRSAFMPVDRVEKTADLTGVSDVTQAARQLAVDLEAAWLNGDFRFASRQLRAAIAADPAAPALRHLLGKMQFELGDYQGAAFNLGLARDALGSDAGLDRMLMLISYDRGEFERALRFGEALLGDETESAEILRVCARSATACGHVESAIGFWKRLFWLDSSAEAASEALALLVGSDADGARNWARAVLAVLPRHTEALVHLWHDCIARGDRARLLEAIPHYEALPVDQLLSLAGAAGEKMPLSAAKLLAGRVRDDGSELLEWITPNVAEWSRRGATALGEGKPIEALEPTQAAFLFEPAGAAAVRARRALARTLRIDARAAIVRGDFARVIAIGEEAQATGFAIEEIDAFLGKAYLETGRTEAALRHLRAAAVVAADPAGAWLQLARSAFRLERHAEAIAACLEAQRAPGSAVVDAATKLLGGMNSRTLKAIRALTSAGKYEDAWTLTTALLACRANDAVVIREQGAIVRALRDGIANADKGDGAGRLMLAQRLLALDPTDAYALRTAAIETMRAHDFETSLRYWVDLKSGGSQLARLDINIEKCRMWLTRQHRAQRSVSLGAAA